MGPNVSEETNTRHPASGKLFKRKNVVGEITPDTNKKADIDETSFSATKIKYKYYVESTPKIIRFNFYFDNYFQNKWHTQSFTK